jgi:adenylosuccinate lyase
MKALEEGKNFKDVLLNEPEVTKMLTTGEIEDALDLDHALRWVDAIFDRVF